MKAKFAGARAAALWATVLLTGPAAGEAARDASPTVVELFTSLACSSCPPADALLAELSRREDVLALSLHVTYWDYLGWKDPYGSEESTARQHAYARALRQRYVYTPEAVVNGAAHAAGSDRGAVLALVDRAADRRRLPLRASRDPGGAIRIAVPGAPFEGKAAVWLFEFDTGRVTKVAAGENAGRVLSNVNVVRGIARIGEWTGSPLEIVLGAADLPAGGGKGCAVIVQEGEAGPILGAARIVLPMQ